MSSERYFLENVAAANIGRMFMDNKYAVGSIQPESCFVELDFGITYSKYQLDSQSEVFARSLVGKTNYDWFRLTGVRGTEPQVEVLKRVYVYSYAKGLLLGLNSDRIPQLPVNSPILVGHGVFNRIINTGTKTFKVDDFYLKVNLKIDDLVRQNLPVRIVTDFDFLKGCISINVNNSFNFCDTNLDLIMSKIQDASNKVKKTAVNVKENSAFLKGGTSEVQDGSLDSGVQDGFRVENSQSKDTTHVGNNISNNPGTRDVEIFSISDTVLDDLISGDSFPLGNSCLCLTELDNWYYVRDRTRNVRESISYFICRANFIYLKDSTQIRCGKYDNYMNSLPRNFERDHWVGKDMWANSFVTPTGNIPGPNDMKNKYAESYLKSPYLTEEVIRVEEKEKAKLEKAKNKAGEDEEIEPE